MHTCCSNFDASSLLHASGMQCGLITDDSLIVASVLHSIRSMGRHSGHYANCVFHFWLASIRALAVEALPMLLVNGERTCECGLDSWLQLYGSCTRLHCESLKVVLIALALAKPCPGHHRSVTAIHAARGAMLQQDTSSLTDARRALDILDMIRRAWHCWGRQAARARAGNERARVASGEGWVLSRVSSASVAVSAAHWSGQLCFWTSTPSCMQCI